MLFFPVFSYLLLSSSMFYVFIPLISPLFYFYLSVFLFLSPSYSISISLLFYLYQSIFNHYFTDFCSMCLCFYTISIFLFFLFISFSNSILQLILFLSLYLGICNSLFSISDFLLLLHFLNMSHKNLTIVNYDSRVVIWANL